MTGYLKYQNKQPAYFHPENSIHSVSHQESHSARPSAADKYPCSFPDWPVFLPIPVRNQEFSVLSPQDLYTNHNHTC